MNISFNDKEKKIVSCIEEITGVKPKVDQESTVKKADNLRKYRIKRILLLSSSYDYFLLEEEGRLSSLFTERHSYDESETPPEITHIESGEECLKLIGENNFDLLIIFNKPKDSDIHTLSTKTKSISKVPIVLLGNNIAELSKIVEKDKGATIDKTFTWNGDGKIILAIVQSIEDSINLEEDKSIFEECRCILLIENSIQFYSTFLLVIYDEIWDFANSVMQDDMNVEQRILRYNRRPYVVYALDFDEGKTLYEKYKDNLLCIITDNQQDSGKKRGKQIGLELASKVRKEKPSLPITIQSSEPISVGKSLDKDIKLISKNAPNLIISLKEFLKECLGPQEIVFEDDKGKEVSRVRNMKDLGNAMLSIKGNMLVKYAKRNDFSKWLKIRGEIELAEKFLRTEKEEIKDGEHLRKKLLDIFEEYRYSHTQATVTSYQRDTLETQTNISRIGKGALGGKARGLTFLAKLVSKYISDEMFPDLKITVPRTIVLSTDVFDTFVHQNNLISPDLYYIPDERIAARFMGASLPATVLGDLRSFIKKTRKPLVVRSSGVLEDSLLQSFAGIYDSILLPNESWETDYRFQEVCNAIKYVYASTYFEKARTYIKSTPKNIGDEKMAVLIQEVVGTKHESYFYPTISGVAKSYNYYPSGPCKPEDGIAYLALGLGKAIVDGGCTYCFCPERPNVPMFGTPKDFIKYSQKKFYALNLKSIYQIANRNEETSLIKLDTEVAKNHGVLDKIASTYLIKDDSLYPGIYDEGSIVIDFGPITNYDAIPLAKALKLLLLISEISLGYPVEIEFAVNLSETESHKAELVILQIRSMLPPGKTHDIVIDEYDSARDICYSENALGNGIIDNIRDIVYVKSSFDMSTSNLVVGQIRKINSKLMGEGKPFILIGPGRWGSADPWLGIPVFWSDIAGVKVIVETPFKERTIDPSQGSHFFHDLISSQVGYLITKDGKGNIDWKWLDSLPVVEETQDIRHVIAPSLETKIDGKSGKAVIRKKDK